MSSIINVRARRALGTTPPEDGPPVCIELRDTSIRRAIDEHEILRAVATYTVTLNAARWWTALAASGVPAAESAFAVMHVGQPLMNAIAKMRPGELRAMYGHLRP